jgi:hypothetical protein
MEEHDRDRPTAGEDPPRLPPVPIPIDLESLLQIVDMRADELALAAESEWTERHLAAARRALRSDFDPKSLAIFECLLSGDRVTDVAARFRTSEQSVYKIKQRVSKRLTEIVQRSIAIERSLERAHGRSAPAQHGESGSGASPGGGDPAERANREPTG